MDRTSNWMRIPGSTVPLPLPVMVVMRVFRKYVYATAGLGVSRQSLAQMIGWNRKSLVLQERSRHADAFTSSPGQLTAGLFVLSVAGSGLEGHDI